VTGEVVKVICPSLAFALALAGRLVPDGDEGPKDRFAEELKIKN